ncbi:MAG: hypothetical protein WCT49_01985 [Candidatus Paceibacterota bacterium]
MKKKIFFVLLAIILSGCSSTGGRRESTDSFRPQTPLEQLVDRGEDHSSLTAKDKNDIVSGIRKVHSNGNFPDVWKSEKGKEIAVLHQGFARAADGNYCMTASVTVSGKKFLPPTPLCNKNGEWVPSSAKAAEGGLASLNAVQRATEDEPILPSQKAIITHEKTATVMLPIKEPEAAEVSQKIENPPPESVVSKVQKPKALERQKRVPVKFTEIR